MRPLIFTSARGHRQKNNAGAKRPPSKKVAGPGAKKTVAGPHKRNNYPRHNVKKSSGEKNKSMFIVILAVGWGHRKKNKWIRHSFWLRPGPAPNCFSGFPVATWLASIVALQITEAGNEVKILKKKASKWAVPETSLCARTTS